MEGQPRQPPSLRGLDEIEQRFDLQQDEVQKAKLRLITGKVGKQSFGAREGAGGVALPQNVIDKIQESIGQANPTGLERLQLETMCYGGLRGGLATARDRPRRVEDTEQFKQLARQIWEQGGGVVGTNARGVEPEPEPEVVYEQDPEDEIDPDEFPQLAYENVVVVTPPQSPRTSPERQ